MKPDYTVVGGNVRLSILRAIAARCREGRTRNQSSPTTRSSGSRPTAAAVAREVHLSPGPRCRRAMKTRSHFGSARLASLAALLFACVPSGRIAGDEPTATGPRSQRMRQPVALAVRDGGKTVLVANRRSGSLSVIDAAARKVVAEYDVGRGLADLARPARRSTSARRRSGGE